MRLRVLAGAAILLCAGEPAAWGQVALPAGPGKLLVEAACSQCHSLSRIPRFRLTQQGWRKKVASMEGYGTSYTEEEIQQIVQYLATNFGPSPAPVAAAIRGVVQGPGGALAGVRVTLLRDGRELQTVSTTEQGEFLFPGLSPGPYQLQAVFPPYPPVVQEVVVSEGASPEAAVTIVLSPLAAAITVTAGRLPVPVTAATANVKIVSEESLRAAPYQTLDDRLRSLPEFSLFRRSSSLVAHPTTQGVSLRGIGPSGVSRSLVLLDGVPLNDAFGGWVYWDSVPLLSLQQVEVATGGQSALYGNYGLGGVVQLLRKAPRPATLELRLQGGSKRSRNVEFLASHRRGAWGISASGSYFDFDGYPVVAESQRGAVDIRASSRHETTRFSLDAAPASKALVWSLRGGLLRERRGNGTPLAVNDTRAFDFSTEAAWSRGGARWEARAFFRRTIFNSNYTAVAADRNSERLTTQQTVPSVDGGGAVLGHWTAGRHSVAAGTDFWLVSGASQDSTLSPANVITIIRQGGGKQATAGLFVQDHYAASAKFRLTAGARLDLWRNYDGRLASFAPGGPPQLTPVNGIVKVVVSPSAGLHYDATASLSLHASLYRAFRAPTLNELYRGFRVGNVVTNPNSGLVPEHTVGGELGGRWKFPGGVEAEFAGFLNRLEKPVSNVTQTVTPAQITRQRQNLGTVRIYGLQGTLQWLPSAAAKFAVSYLWDRAVITEFQADPALVGKRLPQVPEHRATLSAELSWPRSFRTTLIGRFVGAQFDDDQNSAVLDRFFQLDANLARPLGDSANLFVSLENVTNARIVTARSPVDFLGTPFLVRGGIALRMGGGQ